VQHTRSLSDTPSLGARSSQRSKAKESMVVDGGVDRVLLTCALLKLVKSYRVLEIKGLQSKVSALVWSRLAASKAKRKGNLSSKEYRKIMVSKEEASASPCTAQLRHQGLITIRLGSSINGSTVSQSSAHDRVWKQWHS
jgi:hypothetical protein